MSPTATITWRYHEFDIFNATSWVFELEDIAQALSHQCRFNGHVSFYSVAEHSVWVSQILENQGHLANTQLLGLLHDGAEAYLGDIPGPWKRYVKVDNRPIAELEKAIELRMFERFGIEYTDEQWEDVKRADHLAYLDEASCRPAPGKGWDPEKAKSQFIKRYHDLKR